MLKTARRHIQNQLRHCVDFIGSIIAFGELEKTLKNNKLKNEMKFEKKKN